MLTTLYKVEFQDLLVIVSPVYQPLSIVTSLHVMKFPGFPPLYLHIGSNYIQKAVIKDCKQKTKQKQKQEGKNV